MFEFGAQGKTTNVSLGNLSDGWNFSECLRSKMKKWAIVTKQMKIAAFDRKKNLPMFQI